MWTGVPLGAQQRKKLLQWCEKLTRTEAEWQADGKCRLLKWSPVSVETRRWEKSHLAARQTQLHRSALSTRQACTEKYSFCYICHLRLRIELMFLLFYELWLKHNQTVAPTLNGSLTTTAKRLIWSLMQSRRLKLHLTAAFVTMAQMCNVKELTWWVTTHSSHLYSMFYHLLGHCFDLSALTFTVVSASPMNHASSSLLPLNRESEQLTAKHKTTKLYFILF